MNASLSPEIAAQSFFTEAAKRVSSPQEIGVLLHYKLMELASSGKFAVKSDNSIDIPMTATLTFPDPQIESSVCGESCISILDHHIICYSICHHET